MGITEWMRESVCVAMFELYGSLPADGRCECATPKKVNHITHRTTSMDQAYRSTAISQATFDLLRSSTRLDQIVYAHALHRFYEDLRKVERATNVSILCAARS